MTDIDQTSQEQMDHILDDKAFHAGQDLMESLVNQHISPALESFGKALCCGRHRRAMVRGAAISAARYFATLAVANDSKPLAVIAMVLEGMREGEEALVAYMAEKDADQAGNAPTTEAVQ